MGKQTFADELKTYQRTQGKTWFDSLSSDVQRELLDVRAKYLAGEITVPKRVSIAWLARSFRCRASSPPSETGCEVKAMAKPKSLSDELKEVADRESQLAGERRMRALRHANEMLKQERDRAYDQIDVLEKDSRPTGCDEAGSATWTVARKKKKAKGKARGTAVE